MKTTVLTMSLVILISTSHLVSAQDEKGWLGAVFTAEQCLRIQPGEVEVKRKLCRIQYRITRGSQGFTIDGTLDFNEKFVPTRPKRIELEVLFMDAGYVCRRQVNLDKTVTELPVTFSVSADRISAPQYIRTYYILHYQ